MKLFRAYELLLLITTIIHSKCNFADIDYTTKLVFDGSEDFESLTPVILPNIIINWIQFAEKFSGMDLNALDIGDILSGNPTNPLTSSSGATGESIVLSNSGVSTNLVCGVGSGTTLGKGALSVHFMDTPVSQFGFRVEKVGDGNYGNVLLKFYNREGVQVGNKDFLQDAINLGDNVAFRGTGADTVAGFTVSSFGSGICIDDLRFLLATTAPSHVPSLSIVPTLGERPTDGPSLSVHPSSQPSIRPSGLPSIVPSLAPTTRFKPSVAPSKTISENPSVAPSIEPSGTPSAQPAVSPSTMPSGMPSSKPSRRKTPIPTNSPTPKVNMRPVPLTSMPSSFPSSQHFNILINILIDIQNILIDILIDQNQNKQKWGII